MGAEQFAVLADNCKQIDASYRPVTERGVWTCTTRVNDKSITHIQHPRVLHKTDCPNRLKATEFSPPHAKTSELQTTCFKIPNEGTSHFHSHSAHTSYNITHTDVFKDTHYKALLLYRTQVYLFFITGNFLHYFFPGYSYLWASARFRLLLSKKYSAGFTQNPFSFLVCHPNCWFFLYSFCIALPYLELV